MIKFHGVNLEEIAPVKIEDIRVSPITITPVARQKVGFGQQFIRMTGANRTVSVTFALLNSNIDERYASLNNIVQWANKYKAAPLFLPMFSDRYLQCICTGYPEPSYRQWWESKLRLVFTTFENPYWNSDAENLVGCNVPFSIGGTAPPLIRIGRHLSSKAANQTYSANGRSMFFEQIPAGELTIDLNNQTAEVSGTSIMKHFGKTSKFIEPKTGNITITGTGTIAYRERWI